MNGSVLQAAKNQGGLGPTHLKGRAGSLSKERQLTGDYGYDSDDSYEFLRAQVHASKPSV